MRRNHQGGRQERGRRRRLAGKADPNAATKKGLTVGFLPKQVNNPYFTSADKGGEKAVKELGSRFKEVGPTSATDTAGQVSYVNTLTQQQADAMAVSAQDPGALCTALKQAMKNDIKVVTYDSDTKPDCRNAFVSQASAEDLGRTEVQLLAEQIGYKGEIAILSAAQTATNQNTWIEFMKDELKNPKYKDMKLVKVAYGNDDAQQSPADPGPAPGVPEPQGDHLPDHRRHQGRRPVPVRLQVQGQGQADRPRHPQRHAQVRQERHRRGVRALGPGEARRAGRPYRDRARLGQITGQEGETFTAGAMGEYTIGEDGVINLGKPTVFNADNIDQFDF